MHKLTLVLAGLFVMMAGLIGVIAYTTNNQAFVKAQTNIPLDFGNVFPGQSVTSSFTINADQGTYADYTVTLVPPTDGSTDITPYLTVWNNAAEPQTWFVTFSVPDATLASGAAVDYGGTIGLTPITPP
jgi:hypothetical protein